MSLDTFTGRGRFRACAAIAAATLAIACGSSKGGHFDNGGTTGPATDDGGSDDGSSSSGVTAVSDSGTALVFTHPDAAPQMVMFPCQPGTYSGTFMTKVTMDSGLLALLGFSLDWNGTLSITLVGHVMQTTSSNGESFTPAPVLTIAPGAMLSGTDNYGGKFTASLSGQLDCPSKTLSGTLTNGSYVSSSVGTIPMDGMLTAVYQGTPTPPSLAMGSITVTSPSPMYSSLGANGTWSATHQ